MVETSIHLLIVQEALLLTATCALSGRLVARLPATYAVVPQRRPMKTE